MDQNATQHHNPLKQYFRGIKSYLKLPSGISYYTPDVIEFNDDGEIGIMPMTGQDELSLKNPDALLNGEALIGVLNSCVPKLHKPKSLLTNDIEALITAIRHATYNDTLETEIKCPKCKSDNVFKLDLQYALDNMEFLEPEYIVNLDTGLSIFVKPYSFPELLTGLKTQFEQNKLTRALESKNLTDEERAAIFSKIFKEISLLNFDLMTKGIIRIVDESSNVNVTDKKFIYEFLQNTDRKTADMIGKLIGEINKIGIKRSFTAKCEKCGHEWDSEIDFNPVNFL
jgi:predicted Zn-ribbon and HTH transcriptional regulator